MSSSISTTKKRRAGRCAQAAAVAGARRGLAIAGRHTPRTRSIQYAAASRFITDALEYWIARSSRAMTAGVWRVRISRTPPHSRGTMGPSFARQCPSIIEGAGNAGRSMHPKPRVQMVSEAHEHSHHGHTGFTRHSPRNGFTVSFVLSPVTRLV